MVDPEVVAVVEPVAEPVAVEPKQPDPIVKPDPIAKLDALLSILIPPTVTIVDAAGNTYEVTTSFPAARQYRLNKLLQARLSQHPALAGILSSASNDLSQVVNVMLAAASNLVVLTTLSEAFEILHPETLKLASEKYSPAKADVEEVGLACAIFGTEELVRAVVPFGLRQIKVLGDSARPLLQLLKN